LAFGEPVSKQLEQYRGALFVVLVLVVLAGIILFQTLRRQPPPIILNTVTPQAPAGPTATPRPLRVYVSGAVQQPDVYLLAPDSIVKDALLAAGGPSGDADLDRINLAMPLGDGQQVYVPHQGEENPPVQPPSRASGLEGKININTAVLAELDSLPGIGPVMAERIVEYRQTHGPFVQPEDITNVPGIGPATFEEIRDLITTD
jgi:competence protein ComEA